MPLLREELARFNTFIEEKLHNGGAPATLEECLKLWRAKVEEDETVCDIERSLAEIAAGRTQSLADAFQEIREDVGLTARKR